MNFSTSVVRAERGEADVDGGPVVVGKRLADQRLHGVHPGAHLADVLQLVAAVAEHELRLDLDEGLRGEVLVRAVLGVLLVVVELAVGPAPVAGHVRHQRVPGEVDVHVVARRRLRRREAHRALETALADAGLDVMANVLDAQSAPVDRLQQVGGELLVRGKWRPGLGVLAGRETFSRVLRHLQSQPKPADVPQADDQQVDGEQRDGDDRRPEDQRAPPPRASSSRTPRGSPARNSPVATTRKRCHVEGHQRVRDRARRRGGLARSEHRRGGHRGQSTGRSPGAYW